MRVSAKKRQGRVAKTVAKIELEPWTTRST